MAVDTAEKRFSIINITSPWRGVGELPDASIGADDRQGFAYQYGGILAAAPVVSPNRPGTVIAMQIAISL